MRSRIQMDTRGCARGGRLRHQTGREQSFQCENRKKAHCIANEYENTPRTKRTPDHARTGIVRLHSKVSDEPFDRATFQ